MGLCLLFVFILMTLISSLSKFSTSLSSGSLLLSAMIGVNLFLSKNFASKNIWISAPPASGVSV